MVKKKKNKTEKTSCFLKEHNQLVAVPLKVSDNKNKF